MNKPEIDRAAKFRTLQQQFIKGLPERFADIRAGWQTLQQDGLETAVASDLLRHVHSLAGTSATFGFIQLGNQAQRLESLLGQSAKYSDLAIFNDQLEKAIAQLLEMAAEHPEDVSRQVALNTSEDDHRLIYILQESKEWVAETVDQLRQLNYDVEVFHSSADLKVAVNQRGPDILLADTDLSKGSNTAFEAAANVRAKATGDVLIVYMSEHDTWQDRLDASRAGGQAYVSKPINVDELIEHLDILRGKTLEMAYRILIVDDEPLLAEHYAAVLHIAGMETRVLNEPSLILDILPEFAPDLILMDLYMPVCNGVEVAGVIRQHLNYANLPIVYLSTETGLQQQLAALQMGGDDFLQKPIDDNHLTAAIQIRARRFRQLNSQMDKDGLTGLLNHISLKLALEREITRAQRQDNSLSFAMLDIDHFKSVNDQYGHPTGDRVIKNLARLLNNRLRATDLAARYGGEEFAIILPDTSLQDAQNLLNELCQCFAETLFICGDARFSVTFSAGIASSLSDSDMPTLIAAADAALYDAKHRGRNRVMVSDSYSPEK